MATNIESELRSRVDAFAAELADLIRRSTLETLQAVLNGTTTPVRVTTRRKAGRKAAKATAAKAGAKAVRGSSGGRRTTDDLEATADAVLAHVQANPGARMEQIGKAVGAATKDLRRPVQMLADAGKLRTEGQKRGTRYFVGGGRRKKAGKRKAARKKTAKRKSTKKAAA